MEMAYQPCRRGMSDRELVQRTVAQRCRHAIQDGMLKLCQAVQWCCTARKAQMVPGVLDMSAALRSARAESSGDSPARFWPRVSAV